MLGVLNFDAFKFFSIAGLALHSSGRYTGPPNAHCTRHTYTIDLASYTTLPFSSNITVNPTQAEVTDRFQKFVTSPENFTEVYMSGTNSSTGSYALSGVLCVPKAGDEHDGTIQLLVHGIAFDSSYWDFSYKPEVYSYIWAAAEAGYTTFRYDRLGTGESDKPDGYHIVQTPTDLAILLKFVALLREGAIGSQPYSNIIGVGHSYGSIQLTALSAVAPTAVNALVLTGFSANATWVPQFHTSNAFSLASAIFPSRFSSLPGSYIVSGLPQSSQINFLLYPYYDPAAAEVAWKTTQPVTQGVLFTLSALLGGSSSFTGPVHVVTGDRDWVFCAAQCDIYPDEGDFHNLTMLELVGPTVFPKSNDFSVFSPANTGHGINFHYTAPETYQDILGWLKALAI